MRPVVYLSGPIGPEEGPHRAVNLGRAQGWAEALVELGFAPIVPHLYTYLRCGANTVYETWMEVDFALVAAADAVLRITGDSPGGDREVVFARERGRPVFFSVADLIAWAESRMGEGASS